MLECGAAQPAIGSLGVYLLGLIVLDDTLSAKMEPIGPSHQAIVQLVQRVRETNIAKFEGAEHTTLQVDYVPHTKLLLSEALVLAQSLSTEFDKSPEPSGRKISASHPTGPDREFDMAIDEFLLPHSHKDSRQVVADLAFIVHGELKQKLPRLARVSNSTDPWNILAECDHVLRRIRKSFTALENSVAFAVGCTPLLDFYSELQQSLAIRCSYRKFWKALSVPEGPDPTEVRKSLRDMGTRIAMLVGHQVYVDLRIQDRQQLRTLQGRILSWLKGEGDPSVQAGVRICQDFSGFAQMLRQVSRREEVSTYDREIIGQLQAMLELPQESPLLNPSEYSCVSLLEGMNDDLDLVIDAGTQQLREPVKKLVERLAAEI